MKIDLFYLCGYRIEQKFKDVKNCKASVVLISWGNKYF